MLKFSSFVYHYHHPPDAYNAKLLFNHFLRRGREFLEKVKNGWSHGTAVPEVLTLPRVTPPVVCTTSRSAVYWQKSSAAWKNLVSNYLARNHSEGFATKFAKGCRSRCVFGSWREANNYGGLARKVAMFGFVGVAVSANGKPQYLSFENAGSDNIYSAIRDMFTVEVKDSQCELSVSVNSLDDLYLGDVIASDGCGTVFSAEIRQYRPEPDSNIEAALMKDVEMVDEQHQQLTELVDISQAQNTQLRQLMSLPPTADDIRPSSVDISAVMAQASMDWPGNTDEVLGYIEKCVTEQRLRMADVVVAACLQNAELKAACSQLQSSSKVSETVAEEKILNGEITDEDDDDDEGFVVISCDEDDGGWCDLTDHSDHGDDPFPTLINFADRSESLTVAGQREIEPTQLSKVKANCKTSTPDDETTAKEAAVDSPDKTATVTARVEMISSDDGLTPSTLSLISQQLMHVNVVWWSHPTEPPDWHWHTRRRRSELPPHFNVVKPYAGFVTNIANILALGRHRDMLHALPATCDVHRDFAVCTVMKPMKMSLAEFLFSHSVDIRQSELLLLQLMEAVVHLGNYNVSCRNLTSGSIFVELINDEPHLVVGDFGHISLDADDTWQQQRFLSSSCVKSNMSSVAVIASEILRACSHQSTHFTSVVGRLISCLPHSEAQLTPATVANVLHVLLWAPKDWISGLESGSALPHSLTVSWWLVQLAAVTHCYQRRSCDVISSVVSNTLRCTFLSRVNSQDITDALSALNTCC